MNKIYLTSILLVFQFAALAQQYVRSGTIEYEVKVNQYRMIDDMDEDDWARQFKDQLSQFATNYYTLNFIDNKSIYKFSRKSSNNKGSFFFSNRDEENVYYHDYTTGTFSDIKSIDNYYLITDSLKKINWKIYPSDQREIAGFNCRKASTVLFDSVYVFVYYTDEIPVSGGPMGLNGLPGMILGVTIPRMYASWIATGVQLTAPKDVVPPKNGKKTTQSAILTSLNEVAKAWGKGSQQYLQQLIWKTFL